MDELTALQLKVADLEQVIFKIGDDTKDAAFQQAEKDLKFLKEIHEHMLKWNASNDYASRDYAFKMVEDWINELTFVTSELSPNTIVPV